jgi:quinol monooxygenase YgiN
MIGMLLQLTVKKGKLQELTQFLEWDAEVARDKEPGTLRFDVYQSGEDPDVLFIYEAYVDNDAFAAHKANEPFQKFKEVRESCIDSMQVLFGGASPLATNSEE